MQVWNFYFTPYYIFVKLLQSSVKYGIIIKKLIVILYRLEQNMSDLITIIVPCYNEQETIPYFLDAMNKVYNSMKQKYDIDMEYLFVDDGSKDKTLEVLKECSKKDPNVSYLSFSRNFGKEAAMYAGLEQSNGDYVVIIDADLQDPPELIEEMYATLLEGEYDCVGSRRVTRKGESKIRSFFARQFYKIIRKISQTDIVDGARDFRMMTRQMVDSIISVKEYNRFSKGIFAWVGYRTKWLEFENIQRVCGTTKWSFWGLFIYAIDGIVAFSTVPLILSSFAGLLFCALAFIMIFVIIIRKLIFGDPVSGWPSLVCIMCFIAGTQLFCMGIVGMYMSKTYTETKKRPIYILRTSYRCKENSDKR